jgi:beta-phosphoglucomutase-like phosphatase (HAD superfamily)
MAPYDAVLFDFDGVLVDSEPVHHKCWQEVLTPYGVNLDWQTYSEHCIGIADRSMLVFLCELADPPLQVEILEADWPRKRAMYRERIESIGIAVDVQALVSELRGKYKLAVVSSSGMDDIGVILERSGLLDSFDTIVTGHDVERRKPAPDPYLLAMHRLGAKRGLAVEDSKAGVASAREAGLDVVQIASAADLCRLVRAAL